MCVNKYVSSFSEKIFRFFILGCMLSVEGDGGKKNEIKFNNGKSALKGKISMEDTYIDV